MNRAEQELNQIQAWMQEVVMHPGGVEHGAERGRIETVILPSATQTSAERLEVYSRAYFTRLVECLRAEFPILSRAVGEELFDEFAVDYLIRHPSRSYTLGRLGEAFAEYLVQSCPAGDGGWPEFLANLAMLEWSINVVFDGPGPENRQPLDVEAIRAVAPERWGETGLVVTPALKLLRLDYPVHHYYQALRDGEDPAPPVRQQTYLAISRRNYVVRRYEISRAQYDLLSALEDGVTVARAIERLALDSDQDEEAIAGQLAEWFRVWSTEGFFMGLRRADMGPKGSYT
jgi:hypothetical protein